MRISTLQMHNSMNSSVQRSSNEVNKTLLQISTGKEILKPSDDPFASSQLMELDDQLNRMETWSGNIDKATMQLGSQETALTDMNNSLDRARELLLSAGNDTMSKEDRAGVAKELTQTLENLKSLANTKAAGGEHIFAGTAGNKAPIQQDEATGDWSYEGSTNIRELPVSDSQTASLGVTADELFFDDGNDFFGQMDKLITTLNTDPLPAGELKTVIADSMGSLDNTQAAVNSSLTGVGAQMNALETAAETNDDMQLANKSMQSSLEDVDLAEAITKLSMEQTALTASQKSFVSSSKLSLFNYI